MEEEMLQLESERMGEAISQGHRLDPEKMVGLIPLISYITNRNPLLRVIVASDNPELFFKKVGLQSLLGEPEEKVVQRTVRYLDGSIEGINVGLELDESSAQRLASMRSSL